MIQIRSEQPYISQKHTHNSPYSDLDLVRAGKIAISSYSAMLHFQKYHKLTAVIGHLGDRVPIT